MTQGGGSGRRPPSGQRLGTADTTPRPPPDPNVQLSVVGSAVADGHAPGVLCTRPGSRSSAGGSRIPKPSEVYAAAVAELKDADSKSLLKLQQLRSNACSPGPGSPIRKRASSAYAPGALPALPPSPTAANVLSRQSSRATEGGQGPASILANHKRVEEPQRAAAAHVRPSQHVPEAPSQIPASPGARRITSAPDSQSAQLLGSGAPDPWRPILHEPLRTGPGITGPRPEPHMPLTQVLLPLSSAGSTKQHPELQQQQQQQQQDQGGSQMQCVAPHQHGAPVPHSQGSLIGSTGGSGGPPGGAPGSGGLQGVGTFVPAMRRHGPAGICTVFGSPRSGDSSPGILTPSNTQRETVRVARSPSSPQDQYAAAAQAAVASRLDSQSSTPTSTPPGSGLWPRPPPSNGGATGSLGGAGAGGALQGGDSAGTASAVPSRLSSPPVHARRRSFMTCSPDSSRFSSPRTADGPPSGVQDPFGLYHHYSTSTPVDGSPRQPTSSSPGATPSAPTYDTQPLIPLPSATSTSSFQSATSQLNSAASNTAGLGPGAGLGMPINSGVGPSSLNSSGRWPGDTGGPAGMGASGRWQALESAASTSGAPTPTSRPGSGRGRAVQVLMDAVRSKDVGRFREAMEYLRLPNGMVAGLNDRHTVTGRTALHEAVMLNNLDVVSTLLAAGADPHIGHMSQGPPLLHAAAWGESAMLALLLRAGADLRARDIAGYTALHYACAGGHVDAARTLLEHGADAGAVANDGDTPLKLAVQHPSLIQQLFGGLPGVASEQQQHAPQASDCHSQGDVCSSHTGPSHPLQQCDQCDITLSPANSSQLASQMQSAELAMHQGVGSPANPAANSSAGGAQAGVLHVPMPPLLDAPKSSSFRLRSLALEEPGGQGAATGPQLCSVFASPLGMPPPTPGAPTTHTHTPSTLASPPLTSPASEGESERSMPPAPPALELPRGVIRQLSKGAVLQDIIHAFVDEDKELVSRASHTGEGLFGARGGFGAGGGPSLLDTLERKLSNRPSANPPPPPILDAPPFLKAQGASTPSPQPAANQIGAGAPVTAAAATQGGLPAQPQAPMAVMLQRVASFTSQGGSSTASSPRTGLAAAVPTTPRFRFGIDIHRNPPLQRQPSHVTDVDVTAAVQTAVQPAATAQAAVGAAKQGGATAMLLDQARLASGTSRPTSAQSSSADCAGRASATGLVMEPTFYDRTDGSANAIGDLPSSFARGNSGTPLGDSSGDITPPLVSDHSPPASPSLNASIRRRPGGGAAAEAAAKPAPAMAASHSGLPTAASTPQPGLIDDALPSGAPRRHSITDAASHAAQGGGGGPAWAADGKPTDPQRVSQAAHALAVRVGGTSSEALQARALQMFSRSVELQTGGIKWTRGELLGEGSYGRVFAGLNQETGELMAVKVLELLLRSKGAKDVALAQLNQLMQELELYKKLSHTHVVGYIDHFFEPATTSLYIFLEYVPGGSIASMLNRFGRFSEELVRNYTRQLLLGLDYLHASRVVHRDLKGGNVLVTRDGVVKLADFGASKACSSDTINDGMKSLKGSAFWMAPEVIKGTGYNQKADIWSLGCTVIEMLTGQHPWPQLDNQLTAMFQIANQPAGPPRPTNASPLALAFLELCLKFDPQDRPSAAELLHHPWVAPPAAADTPRQRLHSQGAKQ